MTQLRFSLESSAPFDGGDRVFPGLSDGLFVLVAKFENMDACPLGQAFGIKKASMIWHRLVCLSCVLVFRCRPLLSPNHLQINCL